MKGFFPTPKRTVDLMVDRLFFERRPKADARLLDPGCGQGEFIEGVLSWSAKHRASIPRIVGIESDPQHVKAARTRFQGCPSVEIRHSDFLKDEQLDKYDFIIGNPPYVPITGLSEEEKSRYRHRYETATGRFDLYLLFFEQALQLLNDGGRLVFITPEKFLYVETARALRRMLAKKNVEEIRLIKEDTFAHLVTYPTITTVSNDEEIASLASVILRNGSELRVALCPSGASWLPGIMGHKLAEHEKTLEEICLRISCGVATGADGVFVKDFGDLDSTLRRFAFPTIAGRELGDCNENLACRKFMLIPYNLKGDLIAEEKLGRLGDYLSQRAIRSVLMKRTCVQRKPWYAFHETPPLTDILRPKILCKDITERPKFWIDRDGTLVPRHSVYYIVPEDPTLVERLCAHLNSEPVKIWLESHCQRAANGFLRLQSHILKQIPVPPGLSEARGARKATQPAYSSGRPLRREDSKTRQFEFRR